MSAYDDIRRVTALYYAAESAIRASGDEFDLGVTADIEREAAETYDRLMQALVGIASADDRSNGAAALAALAALRRTARRLARLNLAGKAALSVPASSDVHNAAREVFDAVSKATRAAEAEQLTAIRTITGVLEDA